MKNKERITDLQAEVDSLRSLVDKLATIVASMDASVEQPFLADGAAAISTEEAVELVGFVLCPF